VRVRFTPDEAMVIGEAAARVGVSVGAWVGETAVGPARVEAAGDEPSGAGEAGLPSWRPLVAALVALRAEVAAVRRAPIVEFDTAAPADELSDGQPSREIPGRSDRSGVVKCCSGSTR
jgi:hypothetical protein